MTCFPGRQWKLSACAWHCVHIQNALFNSATKKTCDFFMKPHNLISANITRHTVVGYSIFIASSWDEVIIEKRQRISRTIWSNEAMLLKIAVCIRTVGHRPFIVQNVTMAVHFFLTPDKTVSQLQIIACANSQLYYISAQRIVNIITAEQAIVGT